MITIITPVFNAVKHIEGCIENVIAQQCPCVEHLIVDGGSTDGTVDIVERYAQRYPHIRWISEKDRGQSDAMNKGIGLAQGEIVGFLNADDFYEPGVLSRVSQLFETLPQPVLAVGNCNIWTDDGNLEAVSRPDRLKFRQLLLGPTINPFPVNPSQYFYHKSLHLLTGPYDEEEHYAMDLDFLLRAVRVAKVFYFDETWGNFRLIQGTKTHADQGAQATKRREAIFGRYRRYLPWYLRHTFGLYKAVESALFAAGFLKNPARCIRAVKRLAKR